MPLNFCVPAHHIFTLLMITFCCFTAEIQGDSDMQRHHKMQFYNIVHRATMCMVEDLYRLVQQFRKCTDFFHKHCVKITICVI